MYIYIKKVYDVTCNYMHRIIIFYVYIDGEGESLFIHSFNIIKN